MTVVGSETGAHPPSVDALARSLAASSRLPHPLLVECARRAVAESPRDAATLAAGLARETESVLLTEVINATGVLLHTNLGRAPFPQRSGTRALNVELNLDDGKRGSRHEAVSRLLAPLTGAEAAVVVNNNAAAVMLVLAALAAGRDVAVSRGESVEIGGGFRVPEVMEQSGAQLVDVGTTNRTRRRDYERAIASRRNDVALLMKIHPSNFTISGFTESASVSELATLGVPVVADVGSGLLDNTCPWFHGHGERPAFLATEPAVRQTLGDGAALVTFSGDKLLGGPQCGVIAGRADLVAACAAHPLMRALRPGAHVLAMLQDALVAHLSRDACDTVPFWRMLSTPVGSLESRARAIVAATNRGAAVATEALVGAGSAPGTVLASWGVSIEGDVTDELRRRHLPVMARARGDATILDLRSVDPADDEVLAAAVRDLA